MHCAVTSLYRRTLSSLLFTAGVFLPVLAQAATIPVNSLPAAQVVAQNGAYLTQTGCEEIYPAHSNLIDTAGGKPFHVIPFSENSRHFLCSPATAAQLTSSGQVAGLISNDAQAADPGLRIAAGVATAGISEGLFAINDLTGGAIEVIADKTWQRAQGVIIYLLSWIIQLIGELFGWILGLSGMILTYSVSISKFITHDFVKTGWPFVQGITNLGFILVLLFIAFATTLRLDTGMGGVSKLLPKLLIAAVLINFSLIIAGGIIDITRVTMAIETRVLGNQGSVSDIAANVLSKSRLVTSVYNINAGKWWLLTEKPNKDILNAVVARDNAWNLLAQQLQAVVLIVGLAIAMFMIAITFFIRYVILLLLLILSPIPYLAFVLPQSSSLAKQWWSNFLKWAFYGPVALFFLILVTQLSNTPEQYFDGPGAELFNNMIQTILVIIVLFVGATSAKFVGGAGAGFAVGLATGASKKLGKGAYIVSGARRTVREGRAFGDKATEPARRQLGLGKFSKFDEKGNLKAGKSSVGAALGGALGTTVGLATREKGTVEAQKVKALPAKHEKDLTRIKDNKGALDAIKKDAYFQSTYDKAYEADPSATLTRMKADPKMMATIGTHSGALTALNAEARIKEDMAKPDTVDKAAFTKGAVTGAMSKEDIEFYFQYGDKQVKNLMMVDLNVTRAMDDGLKAKVLGGEYDDKDNKLSAKLLGTLRAIDRKDNPPK